MSAIRRNRQSGRKDPDIFSYTTKVCFIALATIALLAPGHLRADGCFVFVWDKNKDINEPTQKAIILHDQGREDLVLQVKYEGLAEDFGWLIPLPGLPSVSKGDMDCFYELSRLTQERMGDSLFGGGHLHLSSATKGLPEPVKVIEIKTVGAYEVAVLSTKKASSLTEWLDAHHFAFPKDKQAVLDSYIQKQWYFVAVKINPLQEGFTLKSDLPKNPVIPASTREKLANGELHPLVLSFPSEKCVFPLAISAVNGKPSEVSLYVLSSEPLASRVVFEKKFEAYLRQRTEWVAQRPARQKAQEDIRARMNQGRKFRPGFRSDDDPADPRPDPAVFQALTEAPMRLGAARDTFYGGEDLVRGLEARSEDLVACSKQLPRLAGKSWWVTKQVQTFTPEEMRDLEFQPAVPLLVEKLRLPEGEGAANWISQLSSQAIRVGMGQARSTSPDEREEAFDPTFSQHCPGVTAILPGLLADADPIVRARACDVALSDWAPSLAPRLAELLGDKDPVVRSTAFHTLSRHRDQLESQLPLYRKMAQENNVAAPYAIALLTPLREELPKEQLPRLLSSPDLTMVSRAFTQLRRQDPEPDQLAPLLTNSLPMARMMALSALERIGTRQAVERILPLTRDPIPTVAWMARSHLRRLTGQKLGADPAAWEQWWSTNKTTFTPQPVAPMRGGRRF